jgi:hypothetical protein
MSCVALQVKQLAHATHPLLAAWAWEFGAGAVLLPLALGRRKARVDGPLGPRVWRIARSASPTVIGSGASVLALGSGSLGVWGAIGGCQILFTAALGALWFREALGLGRWLCLGAAAAAVAALALVSSA